jgi:chorismate-pyruvate lyase
MDVRIGEIMNGKEAIGQAMEARFGPLMKDEFSIFAVSGVFDPDCAEAGGVTWARSYRMSASCGVRLRIEEFFLPTLLRLSGG